MTLLEVDAIHAGYGRINVLGGVTFALAPGEFLGVLGHNGMGKTTLLNAIIGLLPLTAGDIRLNGASIRSLPAHARARLGLGYVPQGRQIFPQLTVRENLAIAAVANRHSAGAAVDRVLAEFPLLRPLADRTGGSLSGGEQQILALGRALCGDPQLILLDEPTEGVQPSIIDQIAEVLAQLHSTRRLSIILVEQNLDFIRSLANRIVVLEKGRIVYSTSKQSGDNVAELVAAAGFGPPPGRTHPHGPTPQPRAQEENHA
jgi:branched-chain amino acid transport system ATP-binding protein